jgi:diacylglycerol kinase family enzyme
VIEIPIAEVNGLAFLNFSAIGMHPQAVAERDRSWIAKVFSKTIAMPFVLVSMLMRLPVHRVRLSTRGHTFFRRTPSIIVCNNPYQMKAFGVEEASVPERGLLNVYVADSAHSGNVLGLLMRAMFGLLRRETKHFTAVALPELRVDAWGKKIRVSVDGELLEMRLPLHYAIRSRPLRVLVPAPPVPASAQEEAK